MKLLVRSRKNKRIAGVCGGLAQYFSVDPTLVRIVFLFLALPGGLPGVIPYLVLWIAMPEEK